MNPSNESKNPNNVGIVSEVFTFNHCQTPNLKLITGDMLNRDPTEIIAVAVDLRSVQTSFTAEALLAWFTLEQVRVMWKFLEHKT